MKNKGIIIIIILCIMTINSIEVKGAVNTSLFVRAYLFDDSSRLLLDTSGYVNGTNTGALYSNSSNCITASGCLNATSSTNSQRAVSIGSLTNADMKTINMWIRSTGTNTKFFFGKNAGADNYFVQMTAPQYVFARLGASGGDIANTSVYLNNSWFMVTMVQNKTTSTYNWLMYVNGTQIAVTDTTQVWATATYYLGGLANDANTGYAFYDDIIIANESWAASDVSAIYKNYTIGNNVYNYTSTPASNSITFNVYSPSNNSHTNDNTTTFWFNVTAVTGVWNATLYVNGTAKGTYNLTNTTGINNITSSELSDGSYSWYINMTDGTTTTKSNVLNVVIDTIKPSITWNNPTASTTVRNTNLTLNVTGTDVNLWAYEYNITNSTGKQVCYATGENITTTTYNITTTCNFTTTGMYSINVTFADSHTINIFPNATSVYLNISGRSIDYTFGTDIISLQLVNYTKVTPKDFSTTKLVDRYTFNFSFNNNKVEMFEASFRVWSNKPIIIVQNSVYKGHVIIGKKYWFDMDSPNVTVIFRESGYSNGRYYQTMTINTTQLDIQFNSLGGLNEYSETKNYFYDNINPTYTDYAVSGGKYGETARWNITMSDNWEISKYIFSTNNTGSWVNNSVVNGNFSDITVTKTISQVAGVEVCGLFYITDSANNTITTPNLCFNVTNTAPTLAFYSQSPADLNLTNFLTVPLNITYNVSDVDSNINNSTILLYYKLNSSVSNVMYYLNGTTYSGYFSRTPLSNTNVSYLWQLYDNQVLPAIYNINEQTMENTTHNVVTLTNQNQFISMQFYNISQYQYGFFEIMANRSVGTGSLRIYYCNSTYDFTNPAGNVNCNNFATLTGNTYHHTHSNYSSHQLATFSVNETTGLIGSVYVTPTSYFIIRGTTSTTWNIYNINDTTRIGAYRSTNNAGGSWTNQTYTVDSHIHQFKNSTLYYYACANDTNESTCTTVRSDNLELGNLAPSAPIITNPTNNSYNSNTTSINITYTASISPNSYSITSYNISLYSDSGVFNQTIIANNGLNLSYLWTINSSMYGNYTIRIVVTDSIGQQSIGISDIFEIQYQPPTISSVSITPVTAYNGNTLTCTGTYTGSYIEGTSTYKWYRNNIQLPYTTISITDDFNPSEQIKCEYTPIDINGNIGSSVNSSINIIQFPIGSGGGAGAALSVVGQLVSDVNITDLIITEQESKNSRTINIIIIILAIIVVMLILKRYVFRDKSRVRR